jgi:hypothetical protein
MFPRRFASILDDNLQLNARPIRFVGWVTGFIHNRVLTRFLFSSSSFELTTLPHPHDCAEGPNS